MQIDTTELLSSINNCIAYKRGNLVLITKYKVLPRRRVYSVECLNDFLKSSILLITKTDVSAEDTYG